MLFQGGQVAAHLSWILLRGCIASCRDQNSVFASEICCACNQDNQVPCEVRIEQAWRFWGRGSLLCFPRACSIGSEGASCSLCRRAPEVRHGAAGLSQLES